MSPLEKTGNLLDPDQHLKNVSVDNVLFGYHERELKVLLQRPTGFPKWTVTGGHVKKGESLAEAADRIAYWRTGLQGLFLQQFRTFGDVNRTREKDFTPETLGRALGVEVPDDLWIFDHMVSIAYYTLTEYSLVKVSPSSFEEISWWPIDGLPPLMFDHKEIIEEALKALRIHIYHYPIGYELLPEKFTLPEIHNLYETISGRSLDSRNFAKRLMATGIIIKLDETRRIGAHRSPYLYRFDKKKYHTALKEGMFLAL